MVGTGEHAQTMVADSQLKHTSTKRIAEVIRGTLLGDTSTKLENMLSTF